MATLEERLAAKRAAKTTEAVTAAPEVSLEERLAAKRASKEASPKEGFASLPVEAVDPDSLSSRLGRAVDNTQASVGGTIEAIGEQLGSESLAKVGSDYRAEQKKEAEEYGQPSISTYKDINGIGDLGSFLEEQAVSSIPGMAAMAAGAKAGSLVPGAAKIPATIGGALFASLGINIGDVQNQIKEIDPEAKSSLGSLFAGGMVSLLDVGGAAVLAKPLLKTLGKSAAEELLMNSGVKESVAKAAVIHAAKGAAAEGATSAAQSVIGNVGAASAANVDLNTEKVIENAINAALGGGALGGAVGGATGAMGAAKANTLVSDPAEAPKPAPDPKAEPSAYEKYRDRNREGLFTKMWDGMGASSLKLLEPWSKRSTEAKEFLRNFRPDMTGETATGKTVFEDSKLMSGKWGSKLTEIRDELGGVDKFNTMLDDYMNNETPVTPAAKKFKTLMDDVHTTAKTEGRLDKIGKIARFLPISADPDTVRARRDEFLQDILPTYGGNVDKANAAIDTWLEKSANQPDQVPNIERLVQVDPVTGNVTIKPSERYDSTDGDTMKYKFSQGQIPPQNSHLEKTRTFGKVPQATLAKYAKEQTSQERYHAVADYFEGAAHRISFSKRFGARGERANAMIAKAVKQAQAAGYRPTKGEVTRMFDTLDAYNGMLNPIQSTDIKQAQSLLAAGLTMKTLPLAGLSTLVEFMTPAIRGDIGSALQAILPTISELGRGAARRMFNGVDRTEWGTMASEAGLSLAAATNVAAQRLGANGLSRGAAKLTTKFFLANGLTLMTHVTRTYAAKTGTIVMQKALFDLASGIPPDSPRGKKALNMLRSMGMDVRSAQEASELLSPSNPSQAASARQRKIEAMHRFASQSVLEPNAADTPMWMSDNRAHLLAMLHRYPSAFTNTILPQLMRRAGSNWNGGGYAAGGAAVGTMFIIGMMITLGYAQDELKLIAKGADKDLRTEQQRLQDVISSTIMPVQASWIFDFINAPRYGGDGVSSMSPTIGFAVETGKTMYNLTQNPEEGAIYKYLYKQTPAQFYRPGREAAGEIDLF